MEKASSSTPKSHMARALDVTAANRADAAAAAAAEEEQVDSNGGDGKVLLILLDGHKELERTEVDAGDEWQRMMTSVDVYTPCINYTDDARLNLTAMLRSGDMYIRLTALGFLGDAARNVAVSEQLLPARSPTPGAVFRFKLPPPSQAATISMASTDELQQQPLFPVAINPYTPPVKKGLRQRNKDLAPQRALPLVVVPNEFTSLAKVHKNALAMYTGDWYTGINGFLRGEKDNHGFDYTHVKQLVNRMDDAFLSAVPTDVPLILYRGGRGSPRTYGEQIAFTSASARMEPAMQFVTGTNGCCMQRITVPVGTPVIYLEPLTHVKGEYEVLLPRGIILERTDPTTSIPVRGKVAGEERTFQMVDVSLRLSDAARERLSALPPAVSCVPMTVATLVEEKKKHRSIFNNWWKDEAAREDNNNNKKEEEKTSLVDQFKKAMTVHRGAKGGGGGRRTTRRRRVARRSTKTIKKCRRHTARKW